MPPGNTHYSPPQKDHDYLYIVSMQHALLGLPDRVKVGFSTRPTSPEVKYT